MYRLKWALLVIIITMPVFQSQTTLQAANTGLIDNVRRKTVLNEQDKKVIDDFIRDSIDGLVNDNDFTSIAKYRDAITSRKDSSQVQYVDQFQESTINYITKAFETAKNIKPALNQAIVTTNLLILIDKLENVKLVILAKNKLDDDNSIVRYWAVKCLANPVIIEQLNSGQAPNPTLPEEITKKLISIVPKSSVESLDMIARYAVSINVQQGKELLIKIADQRIATYASWSVKHEYEDGDILKILENAISESKDKTDIPAIAQRFAQLYSYIIQRYIKGETFLNAVQKFHLESIIIETEDKCIRNMVGAQQDFKKAIETKQLNTLMSYHDKLLGSNATRGEMPEKYNFNYGTNEDGSIRNAPLTLSNP